MEQILDSIWALRGDQPIINACCHRFSLRAVRMLQTDFAEIYSNSGNIARLYDILFIGLYQTFDVPIHRFVEYGLNSLSFFH